MSKLSDAVRAEIRAEVGKQWKCVAFKLEDEVLDAILIGHKIEGHEAQRLACLYIMDGEKTLDAHGPYVSLPMNVFRVGVVLSKNLGLPLCVILVTSAGPYWTVISDKKDVLDGDFIPMDSGELAVQIGVGGFNKLKTSDGSPE